MRSAPLPSRRIRSTSSSASGRGRVRARDRDRLGRRVAQQAAPAAPPDRRLEPVAARAERGRRQRRAGRRGGRSRVGGAGDREPVHERGEARHRPDPRLRVHRADLDRAEARVRPHVPPQERVVGRLPAPPRVDGDVVLPAARTRAGSPRVGRPRNSCARAVAKPESSAVPERRVGGERLQQRAGTCAGRCRCGSPSRGRACRRARAARRSACARISPRIASRDHLVALARHVHDVAERARRGGCPRRSASRRPRAARRAVAASAPAASAAVSRDRRRGLDLRLVEVGLDPRRRAVASSSLAWC